MLTCRSVPKELSDIVFENQIELELRAHTRDEALHELVGLMANNPGVINASALGAEIIEREKLSATVMNNDTALPHARSDNVSEIVLAVGRSRGGILFADGVVVHLIFVIGTPKNSVADYLVCVGTLARLLRNKESLRHLTEAGTVSEFAQILRTAMMHHV